MYDLPTLLSAQQVDPAPKTGLELEVLGKHAAQLFAAGTASSLTEAVVSAVKQAGLAPEQVRRVVEFTNQAAFAAEFKKEGSEHYVQFAGGPADAAAALQDLNDGGGGTPTDSGLGDFATPPKTAAARESLAARNLSAVQGLSKTAAVHSPSPLDIAASMSQQASAPYRGGNMPLWADTARRRQVRALSAYTGRSPVVVKHASREDQALADAFHVESPTDYPAVEPMRAAYEAKVALAAAVAQAGSEAQAAQTAAEFALRDLTAASKEACLSGVPVGHLLAAWQTVVPSEAYVKTAFAAIGPALLGTVYPTAEKLADSIQKTAAAGLVNAEHPVVAAMEQYVASVDKVAHYTAAAEHLQAEHDKVAAALKEAAGGAVGKLLGAAAKGGQGVEKGVSAVGRALVGDAPGVARAARGAGKVVRYAPHIAAGTGAAVGGAELHDRAKYSPAARKVQQYIPGTRARDARLQRIAMGI